MINKQTWIKKQSIKYLKTSACIPTSSIRYLFFRVKNLGSSVAEQSIGEHKMLPAFRQVKRK